MGSYHTHSISGTTYYMEDANSNHSAVSLPSNNTLPSAPGSLISPEYVQLVWGYNYESKSSALKRNSTGRTWEYILPPNYVSSPTNYRLQTLTINTTDGEKGFIYNGGSSVLDSYSDSIYSGQGIIGDMDAYAHIFETLKYKITNISTSNASTASGTATHIIDIDAVGDFVDANDKATRTQNSLDLYDEYDQQPTNSIWRDTNSTWGVIIFNLTTQSFWLFKGISNGSILASNVNSNASWSVNDEIIVMYGE